MISFLTFFTKKFTDNQILLKLYINQQIKKGLHEMKPFTEAAPPAGLEPATSD